MAIFKGDDELVLNVNHMKIVSLLFCLSWFTPAITLSQDSAKDTVWIEPFLASLKTVLNHAERIDFVLLDTKYANVIPALPAEIYLSQSLSEIENYAIEGRRVFYIHLSSFRVDSWSAQIDWQNISARYDESTQQFDHLVHINYSFIYHYDGTRWSSGPSSIQTINHAPRN